MIEEACGWASKGMTEKKAAAILAELQENQRRGEGPRTLREKRALDDQARQEREAEEKRQEREGLLFKKAWEEVYLPHIQGARRNPNSWKHEKSLYDNWIAPVIGDKRLVDISPFHLEKIKSNMTKEGRSPRYQELALAVIRQVFNHLAGHGFAIDNPVDQVKKPKYDNRRMRFLTVEEASALLEELATRSITAHDMALLSLHAGLRFGEIAALQWQDVDLQRGILTLRDTKNAETRSAFMSGAVKAMLERRPKGKPSDYVFQSKKGGRIKKISHAFFRAVDALGLNDGVKDRRQEVCFHSLRHTHASWLIERGANLYAVKEILGHKDFSTTSRYSHLGENTLKSAIESLNGTLPENRDFFSSVRKKLTKRKKSAPSKKD